MQEPILWVSNVHTCAKTLYLSAETNAIYMALLISSPSVSEADWISQAKKLR